jgi:hypothetical protein
MHTNIDTTTLVTLDQSIQHLIQNAHQALADGFPHYTRLACERLLKKYPRQVWIWDLFYKAHHLIDSHEACSSNPIIRLKASLNHILAFLLLNLSRLWLNLPFQLLCNALCKDRYNLKLLLALSKCADRLHELPLTEFFLRTALYHHPKDPYLLLALAKLQLQLSKPEAALQALHQLQHENGADANFQVHALIQQANLQLMLHKPQAD